MKQFRRTVLALCLAILPCIVARAMVSVDLYSAQVPVAGQGPADQADSARQALKQVIVKISGSRATLQQPGVERALADPRRYLQQYTYIESDVPGERRARFEFDPEAVSDLILRAGAPFWTSNRPAVLVWLLLRTPDGYEFVTPDTRPALAAELRETFLQRGLPVRFPVMDLQDTEQLPVWSMWRLSESALLSASGRYDATHVVGGRAVQLSDGRWLGDLVYLSGASTTHALQDTSSAAPFFQAMASLAAEAMSARYAVHPGTAETRQGAVRVDVENITGYSDYNTVLQWLGGLELVEGSRVVRVAGSSLVIDLTVLGSRAQLARIIELNKSFQPLEAGEAALRYRWRK